MGLAVNTNTSSSMAADELEEVSTDASTVLAGR